MHANHTNKRTHGAPIKLSRGVGKCKVVIYSYYLRTGTTNEKLGQFLHKQTYAMVACDLDKESNNLKIFHVENEHAKKLMIRSSEKRISGGP